jgi:hypothetical protein
MFLGKNKKNMRSLFNIFAVLGLAIVILWSSASNTNAQVAPTRIDDFVGDNKTDFVTIQAAAGTPIRWKVLSNPAPAGPNQAFIRHFDFGLASSDRIRQGDFAGDSKTDPTVFRGTNGTWYVGNFPLGTGGVTLNRTVVFGLAIAVFGGNGMEFKAEFIKFGGFLFDLFRFGFVGGDKNRLTDISQQNADFFVKRNRSGA